jgi:CRP-like cAMP-binding protein
LYRQDQTVSTIYRVVSGVVQIISRDRGVEIPVAIRSAGCVLGAISAVLGDRQIETAKTWTSSVLDCLDVATFLQRRRTDSRVAVWVQSLLAHEAKDYLVRTRILMQADVKRRFEFVLADLIRSVGEPRADGSLLLRIPTVVEELAAVAGTTRESLTRLLLKLEAEGTLMRKDRWIIVPAGSPYRAFLNPGRESLSWTEADPDRVPHASGSGSIRRD